jgi:PhzF family phenazine biosynthesis protein
MVFVSLIPGTGSAWRCRPSRLIGSIGRQDGWKIAAAALRTKERGRLAGSGLLDGGSAAAYCAAMRIVQVDAFTDQPFCGNPAAVCVLDGARPDPWLAAVAREMNLSETAFLRPRGADWELRWFTPTVEVELCGHATLAAAHVLWEDERLPADEPARFRTKSGLLTALRAGDGSIALDFPAEPASPLDAADPLAGPAAEALGFAPRWLGRNRFDLFVELGAERSVRELEPDIAALGRLDVRGIIVTAAAARPGLGYDFVSRFFGPAVGVDEDPVTGSAHCALGPFWAARLGTPNVTGYQASARGGFVRVHVAGERVMLIGRAVTVLRAELVGAAAEEQP